MVIGSSGLPAPVISCMIALPMEVTRSVACTSLFSISGFRGTLVTRPSQEPARVFSLSKDFCASDWAKVRVQSDIRTNRTEGAMRDFMFSVLLNSSFLDAVPEALWRLGATYQTPGYRICI